MGVKVDKDLKKMEEMVHAVKTIANMSLQDMVNVTIYLALENKKLKQDFFRLSEDKAENEVMYETAIKEYQEKLKKYEGGK